MILGCRMSSSVGCKHFVVCFCSVLVDARVLQATVHLVSSDQDKSSVFKVKDVVVKVHTLKFSIRDSKHDFFYNTFKPLATRLIKKRIKQAIKGSITTGIEYVDGHLVGVRDRMATEGESRCKMYVYLPSFLFVFKPVC